MEKITQAEVESQFADEYESASLEAYLRINQLIHYLIKLPYLLERGGFYLEQEMFVNGMLEFHLVLQDIKESILAKTFFDGGE